MRFDDYIVVAAARNAVVRIECIAVIMLLIELELSFKRNVALTVMVAENKVERNLIDRDGVGYTADDGSHLTLGCSSRIVAEIDNKVRLQLADGFRKKIESVVNLCRSIVALHVVVFMKISDKHNFKFPVFIKTQRFFFHRVCLRCIFILYNYTTEIGFMVLR